MDFTTWFFVVNFSIMQITSDEHVCFKLQVLNWTNYTEY